MKKTIFLASRKSYLCSTDFKTTTKVHTFLYDNI